MRHVLSRHADDAVRAFWRTRAVQRARTSRRRWSEISAAARAMSASSTRPWPPRAAPMLKDDSAMLEPSNAVMNFPRRDARDKLKGQTRYTVDGGRPGMLHAALLRAETPSARIVRVDASDARKMPGVRAIVTAADAPGRHGIGIADHPLFATGCIRYDGEPIAAVAAETLAQAQAAAAAIIVDLEPLPAVISMADALAPDAPLVHPDWRGYEVLLRGRRARRQCRLGGDRRARRRRRRLRARGCRDRRKRLSDRAAEPPFLRAARGDRLLRGRTVPYRDLDPGALVGPQRDGEVC